MGNVFVGSEIVEIGIQIEKNGRDFYKALADKTKNKKTKEVFEYLEGEEIQHIAVFQKILEPVQKYEPPEAYPTEYFAYMNALASEHIFTKENKGKEIAKKIKSDREAIDLGIGFEKDSIIFYEGMKRVVPKDDERIVNELISQEQSHLSKLVDLKSGL